MMIRLMIVDDEEIVRHSLATLIDWNSLGIEIIATCKNGLEAYDAIMDEYPDIVLTDIQMPGFSGLELITWVNKSNAPIEFVILSGYREFEYAQTAMRLGVRHYLLKPCNNAQLMATMETVIQEQREKERSSEVPGTFASLRKKMRIQTINNILMECANAQNARLSLEDAYPYVEFHHQPYHFVSLPGLSGEMLHGFLEALNHRKEKICPGVYFHMIHFRQQLVLFCESTFMDKADIMIFLSDLLDSLRLRIVPSRQDMDCLYDVLQTLVPMLQSAERVLIIQGLGKTAMYNHGHFIEQANALSKTVFFETDAQARAEAGAKLMALLGAICEKPFAQTLATNILLAAGSAGADGCNTAAFAETAAKLYNAQTTEAILQTMEAFLASVSAESAETAPQYKSFIQKTLRYIDEHLSSADLTLKQIADTYLFMSVNYVSKQFLEQTGMKFSTYLNTKRIERAKQLLLSNGINRIYLIAEEVGCGNNPQYFSQLFRKYTGQTPTAFIHAQAGTPDADDASPVNDWQ